MKTPDRSAHRNLHITWFVPAVILATLMATATMAQAPPASQEQVQRGAYLARAGDCIACHTVPKGQPYVGGLPLDTPIGKVYSTNITPDPETGIGRYSTADFLKVM